MQGDFRVHAEYRGRAVVSARLAGFARRSLGAVIDRALIVGLDILIARLLDNGARPVTHILLAIVAIDILYFIWGYGDGQTVGCILTGMRIVSDRNGVEPGYRLGLFRWLCESVSLLSFGFGYLWSFFDSKHQTWHDKLAGTVVIIDDAEPDPFWKPSSH
jgi:uncharacterized RDD family membrane protein YckC